MKRVRNKSLHQDNNSSVNSSVNGSVLEVDDLVKPKKNISETTFLAGTKDIPQSTIIEEENEEIILLD